MKINVGCGRRVLPGYTNVDVAPMDGAKPDLLADAKSIPLPDGCASELMAVHVFEHFYLKDVPAILAEWRRLLRPSGLLVLELPNIVKCCQNVVDYYRTGKPDITQMGLWGIYGDNPDGQEHMAHKWGWTPQSLGATLILNGFDDPVERPTKWHPKGRDRRDMRIEALRGTR